MNFRETISTPVTISRILNGSQLDAESRIQAEKTKKLLKEYKRK